MCDIEEKLISRLFSDGRLDLSPTEFRIKSISVKPLAVDGFMLTAPTFVRIEFVEAENNNEEPVTSSAVTHTRTLVVKVSGRFLGHCRIIFVLHILALYITTRASVISSVAN